MVKREKVRVDHLRRGMKVDMGAGGVLTIVGASEIAGGDIRVTYRGGHSTVYGTSTFFTVVTQ